MFDSDRFGNSTQKPFNKRQRVRISTGVFGALLFINDLEYLGSSNTEFFKNNTLPLLEGLLDWWACYLVKRHCSPAGTHACPIDGWRYDDANDAVRT